MEIRNYPEEVFVSENTEPAGAMELLPGVDTEMMVGGAPLAVVHFIRHGQPLPITLEAIRDAIYNRDHPEYLENLEHRLNRDLSSHGRSQIHGFMAQEFWPDFYERVPDPEIGRSLTIGYSGRIRTESSAREAEAEAKEAEKSLFEFVDFVHMGELNTTYVVDAIEEHLARQHIDSSKLKGPDALFPYMKYWINSLYDSEIAYFFSKFDIPNPYQLGEVMYKLIREKFNSRMDSYNATQDSYLLFTHESTLYALLSYLSGIDDLPYMDYAESIRLDFYEKDVAVVFDGTVKSASLLPDVQEEQTQDFILPISLLQLPLFEVEKEELLILSNNGRRYSTN